MSSYRPYTDSLRSIPVDFYHGLSKSLRSFLRQIVPCGSLHDLMGIFAREFFAIGGAVGGGCNSIGFTIQSDRRYADERTRSQLIFKTVIFGIAFGEAQTPAVIVDHDGDVIRVVERCRAA